MKKVLLIDGNFLLFRSFYANAYNNINILKNFNNVPTNAVFIFINILNKLLKINNYYSVVVAFDKGKKNFRHNLLIDYKYGRHKTPNDLILQFPIVKEFLNICKISYLEKKGYEADDLLGCLSKLAEKKDFYVDIFSGDKDLYQLITDKTNILIPYKYSNNKINIINKNILMIKLGILPLQIPDLKGLMGDYSDNLKGIPRIGEKTAIKLIKKYYSIENLYDNINDIKGVLKQNLLKYKDYAILCKKISTIFRDINLDYFNFIPFFFDKKKLTKFYLKYNMNSFLSKLFYEKNNFDVYFNIKVKIIKKWYSEFNENNTTIYLELLNENYHTSKIIGFGIINSKGIFYFDYIYAKNDKLWHDFLKNNKYKKSTYNAKSLIVVLARNNIFIQNIVYDMMLACYIYNSNIKDNLNSYINWFEKKQILNDDFFYGKGIKKQIPDDLLKLSKFIGKKVFYIHKLKSKIIKLLKNNKQYNLYYYIELPTTFALARMEIHGVKINKYELEIQTLLIKKNIIKLKDDINNIAQKKINPNSPKQISELLFKYFLLPNLKNGSTSRKVLEKIKNNHIIIKKILYYRKYQKLYSTYLKGIKKYIFSNGSIHTIYKQTFTNTGRLSSVCPNMQNITIHDDIQKKVRKIFVVSSQKNILLSCDYSQIELRILAHMSKDKNLINSFNNNEDIHINTAMKIFNLSKDKITNSIRNNAKNINFSIIYGISYFRLSNDLNISISKAKKIINDYYYQFPKIKKFIKKQIEFCKKNGYVKTIFNRKRYVPEINDNNCIKQEFGKRIAINMPIQGSAADIIKISLKNIDKKFTKLNLKSKIIMQIHDELIFEIPQNELTQVKKIIKKIMENFNNINVKLIINMKTGLNLYDLIKK